MSRFLYQGINAPIARDQWPGAAELLLASPWENQQGELALSMLLGILSSILSWQQDKIPGLESLNLLGTWEQCKDNLGEEGCWEESAINDSRMCCFYNKVLVRIFILFALFRVEGFGVVTLQVTMISTEQLIQGGYITPTDSGSWCC